MTTSKPSKSSQQAPAHDAPASNPDPMEAIYALNIGDFVAESFISEDLLNKISDRLADDPGRLQAQLEELIQIYSIDKTLNVIGFEQTEGFVLYDSVCETLADMFDVDGCHIFQVARKENGQDYLSLTGTSKTIEPTHRWEIGSQTRANNWLSDAFRSYQTQVVPDVGKLPNWKPIEALGQAQTKAVLAVALREGGKDIGLLLLEQYNSRPQPGFAQELRELAEATARIFVTSNRLQQLIAQAQRQLESGPVNINGLLSLRAQITESIADLGVHQQQFVETLATAIDARHDFTRGHSQSVARIAQGIAEGMGLNEKTVDLVYYAGLLGSVGKFHIPHHVLAKSGELNPEEWESLRNHPNVGASLLGKINFLAETTPYVQSQRERWDGSGSPEGLSGRNIPLGSRILAVADAYFAMTHPRPYRDEPPMSHQEAIAQLEKEAGQNWDPDVVKTLASLPPDSLV